MNIEHTTEIVNKSYSINELSDDAKEIAYINVFYTVYEAFYGKEASIETEKYLIS